MDTIIPISAFKDNYIWLFPDKTAQHVWVVDPGDAVPVIQYLHEHQLQLAGILITHHHADHTGGVADLLECWNVPVYGFSKSSVPTVSHVVKEGDIVDCGLFKFKVLEIPGHTLDHIAYFNDEVIFCGDTLFSAGCGRVFEGTYEQMYESLMKLASLSDHAQVYCAHEYTLQNLKFASHVEPENNFIQEKIAETALLRAENKVTIPSVLRDEKKMNPFLRCQEKAVIDAVAKQTKQISDDPMQVFKSLREWKNSF
jgi:hydroxyacylglutathione hydrolase